MNPRLAAEFVIWSVGLSLQLAILSRGAVVRLWRIYALFYAQIACSFLTSSLALWIFLLRREEFTAYYWNTEFVTAFVGCGILLDILRHAFAIAPATRLFARAARYAVCSVVALFFILYIGSQVAHVSPFHLIALERDFRLVQTALLLGLTTAIFYFGLPLGRNLRGMLVGYGLYIASNLVTLTLESRFAVWFGTVWNFLQPILYCSATAIYLWALWSFKPPPSLGDTADIAKQAGELLESVPERLRLLQ